MENISKRTARFYWLAFRKYDLRSSITVFFVALPLCLGISLASGTPVYAGLIAGIIGGLLISLLSGSQLSVSGPAAGLTTIAAAAILKLGSTDIFFLAVSLAGIFQLLLGVFRLGGFTHFIPSSVIKGMLTAIGIILISKQIPPSIGYSKPEFWSNELFNILTFDHVFSNIRSLYMHTSAGVIIISILSLAVMIGWKRYLSQKVGFIPTSFVTVLFAILLAQLFKYFIPSLAVKPDQFVSIPSNIFSSVHMPDLRYLFSSIELWRYAVIICFVASLETLLSIEAIDKLDRYNRITPQNRELMAQGTGNLISGLIGGLPITAVIVRSSANAEAGARTKLSAFFHGLWLLLLVLFAVPLLNLIPYAVLAVILIRTGYNLAKPSMVKGVYRQGREQFIPFLITVLAILFTDLLIGVIIGVIYSIYFIVKHTYRAGFVMKEEEAGGRRHIKIELALNVSFLNKKRIIEMLDQLPAGCRLTIDGTDSVYIDHDILEVFQDFRSKAAEKNITLEMKAIPAVETLELH
jgi:MFS superfamily sulfate permease-like transporter